MRTWEASLKKRGITHESLTTVPRLGFESRSRLYLLALAIYFVPGTLLRLCAAPVFEFTYKVSPALVVRFLRTQARLRPASVIFSHHSSFYLSLFTRRARRVFVIHDLMYVRAKSFGASRRLQRFTLAVELWVYRFSPKALALSYQEGRVLKRFLRDRAEVHLIRCCPLSTPQGAASYRAGELAVIADWRRPENVHGASHYFSQEADVAEGAPDLRFRFVGFGSGAVVERLRALGMSRRIAIADGGVFEALSSIEEGYILVPIYRGAGIKVKTLQALCAGRVVMGTRGAFIGLPPWVLSAVTRRVASVADVRFADPVPRPEAFEAAVNALREVFVDIADVPGIGARG